MWVSAVAAAAPHGTVQERGVSVSLGPSFYRPESCFSRDLAVLSAVVHRRHRYQHQQHQQQQQQQHARPEVSGSQQGHASVADSALPPLHVADLMAGSGIRSVRYLVQAGADHVLCNEGDLANAPCLEANLGAAVEAVALAGGGAAVHSFAPPGGGRQWQVQGGAAQGQPGELPLCELRHEDALSLLARCRLEGRHLDLIDSDSFGAAAHFVGAALDAVRFGGLVCLTSTAGTISGGRDPASALALYGQHLAPVPFANEQGLRMLIGLAHREALARRLVVKPLWSMFSPHGPVFRSMLAVDRPHRRSRPTSAAPTGTGSGSSSGNGSGSQYGYVLHRPDTWETSCCSWHDLPGALAGSGGSGGAGRTQPPLLSGPLWLGPLHDYTHLRDVQVEAAARGWVQAGGVEGSAARVAGAQRGSVAGSVPPVAGGPVLPATRKGRVGTLELLLELLVEEAATEEAGEAAGAASAAAAAAAHGMDGRRGDAAPSAVLDCARLPPWHLRTSDVGRAGRLMGPPSRRALMAELRRRGFLACRSHVDASAIRTNASMAQAVAAAVEGLGIRSRAKRAAPEDS